MTKKASKTKEELEQAIRDTISGINDVLAKSGHPMGDAKEDKNSESHGSEKMEKTDEDEDEEEDKMEKMDPEAGLAEEEYESPEEADSEMDAQAAAEDGMQPEGGDEMAAMQEHLSTMSDEELSSLIEMLTQEQQSRGDSAEGEQGFGDPSMESEMDPGMESPEPSMEAPAPEMEKNYKEDYLKLTKSMSGINGAIEKLAGAVEKISAEVTTIKNTKARVSQKVAVSRSGEALEKSSPAPKVKERLSKSETQDFLLNEVRKGNPQVNRRVILDLNYVENDEQLGQFQDTLTKQGLKFPEL